MYLEIQLPAERGLLVKTPDGVRPVSHGVPGLVVEPFRLLGTAEQQRQREFSLISALGLENEIDQSEFLVQAPCPEVGAVDEFVSYPDLHGGGVLEDVRN